MEEGIYNLSTVGFILQNGSKLQDLSLHKHAVDDTIQKAIVNDNKKMLNNESHKQE
jgi:hypothetical protein